MERKIGYIVSWLLTRRCNLNCEYCRIRKSNYENSPYDSSPFISDLKIVTAIDYLQRLQKNNFRSFHLFYGGEPTLYKHLDKLIEFCNKNSILYTIITNMTDISRKRIKKLLNQVGFLNGLTFSLDPLVYDINVDKSSDRYKKSILSFKKFIDFKDDIRIREFVAEITADRTNVKFLVKIVEDLTRMGIWSDITTIEYAKNPYYDFAESSYSEPILVSKENSDIFLNIYERAKRGELKVIGYEILPILAKNLPQNYNCKIDKYLDNITIDSNGFLRLCLRIRGIECNKLALCDILSRDGKLVKPFNEIIRPYQIDKKSYCERCIWTCAMFTKLLAEEKMDMSLIDHEGHYENFS